MVMNRYLCASAMSKRLLMRAWLLQGDRVKLPVNCCGVLAFVKCTGLRLRGRSPRNPEPGDSYGRILRGLDQEVPSQSHGSARPRADAAFVDRHLRDRHLWCDRRL